MARTEKKTKIKGLPPRVFLNERDAATGSYPYVPHNGTVNQNLRWLPFSDQNTLVFTQSNIYYGLGVPTASNYIPRLTFITTSLTGTGSIHAGIVDTYFNNQRYDIISQAFVPFKENDQFQADGKSITGSFWVTGTNVEGLTAPVWSKTKIEIPLSVGSNATFKIRRDTNFDSYQMGYFNFASKTWEGCGLGYDVKMLNDQLSNAAIGLLLSHSLAGFAPGMFTPRDSAWHIRGLGEPIQSFGFPFAPKYHATSSQLLSMKNLIDRPFLVEKFVVLVSASFSGSATSISETMTRRTVEANTNLFPIATNTFFVLNQRRKQNFIKPVTGLSSSTPMFVSAPTSSQISKNGSAVFVDTVRDLVGYANVVSFASNLGTVYSASLDTGNAFVPDSDESFENRSIFDDLRLKENLISTGISGAAGTWWGPRQVFLSGTMAMPYETEGVFSSFAQFFPVATTKLASIRTVTNTATNLFSGSTSTSSGDYRGGGRNGFGGDYYDNRSLFTSVPATTREGKREPVSGLRRFVEYKKTNPYLLLPEDNLVIGWQLPILYPVVVASVSSSNTLTMTFHPGEAKLVLYGSFLSDGQEIDQSLSQNLTSNTVHEAIE